MQHSPRKFWEVWGRSDALYNRWAAAHGVNNSRLFVLYVLDNHPGATQKAIADHAGLPKQTVNTVVRALRDEAIYSPAQVKKRVYIVDEVHRQRSWDATCDKAPDTSAAPSLFDKNTPSHTAAGPAPLRHMDGPA